MNLKQAFLHAIGFIILCFLFSACASSDMKVDTDNVYSETFENLKTYSWLPKPNTGEPRLDINNDFHQRLQRTVDDQLNAKGYIKKPHAKGDFLITYAGKLNKISKTKPWSSQYRPGLTLGAPETVNYISEEGHLTIKFLNPETKEIIWQGSAADRIKKYSKSNNDRKQLDEAIRKIFADIPDA